MDSEELYDALKKDGTKIIIRSDSRTSSFYQTKILDSFSNKGTHKSHMFISHSSESLNSNLNAQVRDPLRKPPGIRKHSQYFAMQLLENSPELNNNL
jgi:hypothetical protein